MKEIYTPVTAMRRRIFEEVANLAFDGGDIMDLKEIPYKIVKGDTPSALKERAIATERLRLACGLSLRDMNKPIPREEDYNNCVTSSKYYEAPLINIMPFACEACPTKSHFVTNNCRGCLAHPCVNVCPVGATSMQDGVSVIDDEKCINCGKCAQGCPYNAIVKYERPCAAACGVDAIGSDEIGRAKIDYNKCVSCGQCLVNCPFAAIADKSQIFQLILAMKSDTPVIAEVAPAFVSQFGPNATPEKIKEALIKIGFSSVHEVALGADVGTLGEVEHFAHKVATGDEKFLGTSCCPSWSVLAKNKFPELKGCISTALTPMVATARILKKENPEAKIVFIGPCASKKLEASRQSVRSDVDFVITYEELMAMFVSRGIEFTKDETDVSIIDEGSATGRKYAIAGGVSAAIAEAMKEKYPEIEFKVDRAEGLRDCTKMLTLAKAGKRDGYLLEGMACPGGCVGGAGTLNGTNKSTVSVSLFADKSSMAGANDNEKAKNADVS